jgi:hypothetical protein
MGKHAVTNNPNFVNEKIAVIGVGILELIAPNILVGQMNVPVPATTQQACVDAD